MFMSARLLASCCRPQSSQGFSPKCISEKTVILKVPSLRKVRRGLLAYGLRSIPSGSCALRSIGIFAVAGLADELPTGQHPSRGSL